MSTINLSKQTVNLSKGEKINLSKSSEGLKKVMIGLGWDPVDRTEAREVTEVVHPGFFARLFGAKDREVTRVIRSSTNAADIDCDAWVALLKDGEFVDDYPSPLIYYGNKTYYLEKEDELVIKHHGDNLTGEGDGDDEQITINLDKIPKKYDSILVGVTIYQGDSRGQSFGNIKNTFVRVVDERDNFEICRFNQKEMADNKDALTFIAGKLTRKNKEWQFEATGKCTMDRSISKAVDKYR